MSGAYFESHFAVLEDQFVTTSLDTGKVDLAEVASVWQLWWRHRLPAQAVACMGSEASLAGATHVLQSKTGGAEEQAHSLFGRIHLLVHRLRHISQDPK